MSEPDSVNFGSMKSKQKANQVSLNQHQGQRTQQEMEREISQKAKQIISNSNQYPLDEINLTFN